MKICLSKASLVPVQSCSAASAHTRGETAVAFFFNHPGESCQQRGYHPPQLSCFPRVNPADPLYRKRTWLRFRAWLRPRGMRPRAPLLAVLLAACALTASAFNPPADLVLLGGSRLGALGRSVHGGSSVGRRDACKRGPLMHHHESRRMVLRSGLLVPFAGATPQPSTINPQP